MTKPIDEREAKVRELGEQVVQSIRGPGPWRVSVSHDAYGYELQISSDYIQLTYTDDCEDLSVEGAFNGSWRATVFIGRKYWTGHSNGKGPSEAIDIAVAKIRREIATNEAGLLKILAECQDATLGET